MITELKTLPSEPDHQHNHTFNKARQFVLVNGDVWTLTERKTFNYLLYHISQSLLSTTTQESKIEDLKITIPDNDFRNTYHKGYNFTHAELQKICRKITTTTFNTLDTKTGEWKIMSILPTCSYSPADHAFIVELTPSLAEMMRNPELGARISLMHQRQYKSGCSLILYECCSLMLLSQRAERFTTEDFLKMLGLNPKVKFTSHLTRTILPNIELINKNKHGFIAKLTQESETKPGQRKVGRPAITHVVLEIEIDEDNAQEIAVEDDPEVIESLRNFDIAYKTAKTLMLTYGKQVVMSCYKKTLIDMEEKKSSSDPIRSPSSWFLSMIRDEAWKKQSYEPNANTNVENRADTAARKAKEQLSKEKQRANEAWMKYINSSYEDQNKYLTQFGKHLIIKGSDALISAFQKDGIFDKDVRPVFLNWLIGWTNICGPDEQDLEMFKHANP